MVGDYSMQLIHIFCRDLRMECRRAVRLFEAAMESVVVVDEQLLEWEELEDLYSGKPFWKNARTGQISLEKPGHEHYLPITFRVPSPPPPLPPGVSLDTSSSDDENAGKVRRALSRSRGRKSPGRLLTGMSMPLEEGQGPVFSDIQELGMDTSFAIDGEVHVSDNEVEELSDRDSTAGTTVPRRPPHLDLENDKFVDRLSSTMSMLVVTTARTDAFAGQSFFNLNEPITQEDSIKEDHSDQSEHPMTEVSSAVIACKNERDSPLYIYGPDQLRAEKGLYIKRGFVKPEHLIVLNEDGADVAAGNVDVRILEMHSRIEAARAFQRTEEYRRLSLLRGEGLVVAEPAGEEALNEIKQLTMATALSETAAAEKAVLKVIANFNFGASESMLTLVLCISQVRGRSQPGGTKHETYMRQKLRKPQSFEQLKKLREAKEPEPVEDGNLMPLAEELLYFAGGDNRMTWAKGDKGMQLRTVLAHRALHVEKKLHEDAVAKGFAKPKKNDFFTRELAPMFKEGLPSSDEETGGGEDGDEEQRKERVARRIAEQKRIFQGRRKEEDRKAMEALRLRRERNFL